MKREKQNNIMYTQFFVIRHSLVKLKLQVAAGTKTEICG